METSMSDDDDVDDAALADMIRQDRALEWQTHWYWKDKPVGERGAARDILEQAGLRVEGLRSREAGQDPPDCEAMVDGQWSGIEVTALVHQKNLERAAKGKRQYFSWPREALLEKLQ